MFGTPALQIATAVTFFAALVLIGIIEIIRESTKDPFCVCNHPRSKHDMTFVGYRMGPGQEFGQCLACICRGFHFRP
jgi:hypothetical protein